MESKPQLHIFNPEHDLALAAGRVHFNAPAAAVKLRDALCFLPAFWADNGDWVLVDDVCWAEEKAAPFSQWLADVRWVTPAILSKLLKEGAVGNIIPNPWGWDVTVRDELRKMRVPEEVLPDDDCLEKIRQLSGRIHTYGALRVMNTDLTGVIGEVLPVNHVEEIKEKLSLWRKIVMKAPWSSSGRGVMFVDGSLSDSLISWAQHVIDRQGYLMVEKFLDKQQDFAMEFYASENGMTEYVGLSLFDTRNAAYAGNVIAPEEDKMKTLQHLLPKLLLEDVKTWLCRYLSSILAGNYVGPLGVDMMVVRGPEGGLLNPCVEINLRRTMGHLAVSLSRHNDLAGCRFVIDGFKFSILGR
ncbi:MAG: hypothetical protein IKX36_09480 [Prevotella sp.]|nr:hypothetical protein [Prevotella sp.]